MELGYLREMDGLESVIGEGNGNPLQSSCLENPVDRGAWWAAVHGVVKSQTQLSDFTFTFHFHALEKEMATHPSVLAWRIPGTGEPGELPSLGSHRVGHEGSDLAAESVIQSEVRKRKIDTVHYTQNGIDDLTCKAEMETERWRTNV